MAPCHTTIAETMSLSLHYLKKNYYVTLFTKTYFRIDFSVKDFNIAPLQRVRLIKKIILSSKYTVIEIS